MMSKRSTWIALGRYMAGFTKPPTKNIGINWSPAFSILAHHCQNAQKHGDHSHPGAHDETPAADALLIMIVTTTVMKMEMMTATMTETTQIERKPTTPPITTTNTPPHTSQGHMAPPLPPNMNQNDGSTTPSFANKSDAASFILSQF